MQECLYFCRSAIRILALIMIFLVLIPEPGVADHAETGSLQHCSLAVFLLLKRGEGEKRLKGWWFAASDRWGGSRSRIEPVLSFILLFSIKVDFSPPPPLCMHLCLDEASVPVSIDDGDHTQGGVHELIQNARMRSKAVSLFRH